MKKIICLLLVVALFGVMVIPTVSAEGNPGGWYELLSVNSINSDGSNTFFVPGKAGSVTIPLVTRQQVRRVDILVWHTATDFPVTAIIDNTSLVITRIDNSLSRIYGTLPSGYRESLVLKVTDNSTYNATWELLSVKLTASTTTDYLANAEFFLNDVNEAHYPVPGYAEYQGGGLSHNASSEFGIIVNDWKKYDTISITGSVSYFALNSVRASLGSIGIPFTLSYTSTNPSDSTENYAVWTEIKEYVLDRPTYAGSTEGTVFSYDSFFGKVLFHLTMDVSGLDRRINDTFVVCFTGLFDDAGYYEVQIVGVTGAVNTADTSDVTWWTRFTTFMTGLFSGDTQSADQFQDDMEEANNALSDANEQLDSVTKPDIEDVPLDPSDFIDPSGMSDAGMIVQSLLGNEIVLPMATMTMIVGLAAFIIF